MAVGKRLVDDRHPRGGCCVTFLNHPSANQADPERVERLGIDFVEIGAAAPSRVLVPASRRW